MISFNCGGLIGSSIFWQPSVNGSSSIVRSIRKVPPLELGVVVTTGSQVGPVLTTSGAVPLDVHLAARIVSTSLWRIASPSALTALPALYVTA